MVRKEKNVISIAFGERCYITVPPVSQWDNGQILVFNDIPDGVEVQFSNENSEETLNRVVENGQVEIPDILLQTESRITAYICYSDESSRTTVRYVYIPVKSRTKPADYVTPEDYPTYRDLIEKAMKEAKSTAESLKKDAESGAFNGKDGKDGKDGKPGMDGQNGADGVSPIISVEETDGSVNVTITDAEGSKNFSLTKGGGGGGTASGVSKFVSSLPAPSEAEKDVIYYVKVERGVVPQFADLIEDPNYPTEFVNRDYANHKYYLVILSGEEILTDRHGDRYFDSRNYKIYEYDYSGNNFEWTFVTSGNGNEYQNYLNTINDANGASQTLYYGNKNWNGGTWTAQWDCMTQSLFKSPSDTRTTVSIDAFEGLYNTYTFDDKTQEFTYLGESDFKNLFQNNTDSIKQEVIDYIDANILGGES